MKYILASVLAQPLNAWQLAAIGQLLNDENVTRSSIVEYQDEAYMRSQGPLFQKFFGAESLTSKASSHISTTIFNPSLIELPAGVAKSLHPGAVYLASLRHHCTCQCENLGKNVEALPFINYESSVALLDANFNVLALAEIHQGEDMRLLSAGDHVLSSYGMPKSRWHFAELAFEGDPKKTSKFEANFVNINLTKSKSSHLWFKLSRNIGVIAYENEQIYLVMSIDAPVRGPMASLAQARVAGFHNNINPLPLPELNGYLGVAHSHDGYGSPARYGKNYSHAFFLLDDKPPFKMLKSGTSFCLPALHKNHARDDCEIIQFIGSVIREPNDPKTLLIAYGINDCEAAVVRVKLQDVIDSLEDVPEGGKPGFVMTAALFE